VVEGAAERDVCDVMGAKNVVMCGGCGGVRTLTASAAPAGARKQRRRGRRQAASVASSSWLDDRDGSLSAPTGASPPAAGGAAGGQPSLDVDPVMVLASEVAGLEGKGCSRVLEDVDEAGLEVGLEADLEAEG